MTSCNVSELDFEKFEEDLPLQSSVPVVMQCIRQYYYIRIIDQVPNGPASLDPATAVCRRVSSIEFYYVISTVCERSSSMTMQCIVSVYLRRYFIESLAEMRSTVFSKIQLGTGDTYKVGTGGNRLQLNWVDGERPSSYSWLAG
jgi:hypothetical protein